MLWAASFAKHSVERRRGLKNKSAQPTCALLFLLRDELSPSQNRLFFSHVLLFFQFPVNFIEQSQK